MSRSPPPCGSPFGGEPLGLGVRVFAAGVQVALEDLVAEADQICDWTPKVPVHLYTSTADTDVVPANADVCAATLTGRGATVAIHSMGQVDHFGTAFAAYPQIVRAFGRWA